MENKNKGAFPYEHEDKDYNTTMKTSRGLTKREYFAAMAMQSVILRPDFRAMNDYQEEENPIEYVERKMQDAVIITDIMLKALKTPKQ